MTKSYIPAQIEAGFRAWAQQRRDAPDAFLPHAEADAMTPADRAPLDAQQLIECMDALGPVAA